MILTDLLRELVSHSTLGPFDKARLHDAVGSLEEGGLTVTDEQAEAKKVAAAAAAKAEQVAALKAQLAALEGVGSEAGAQ